MKRCTSNRARVPSALQLLSKPESWISETIHQALACKTLYRVASTGYHNLSTRRRLSKLCFGKARIYPHPEAIQISAGHKWNWKLPQVLTCKVNCTCRVLSLVFQACYFQSTDSLRVSIYSPFMLHLNEHQLLENQIKTQLLQQRKK